jgi:hypothetical protein
MTVTQAVSVARSFFCFSLPPLVPLPLDRLWIYALNRIVNQVNGNCNWEGWRSQVTHLLAVVSARRVCIPFIKSWSNCTALSKFQQINFIERIDTPDRSQNDIPSISFDRSKSDSPNRPASVDTGRKERLESKF